MRALCIVMSYLCLVFGCKQVLTTCLPCQHFQHAFLQFTSSAFAGPGLAAALALPYYIPNTMYGAMSQAPSSTASYENYSNLQKNRLDAPFFLSGRPATAKVRLMT